MIQYIINTTLCSGLLFFLYKLLLANEKMHVFKRFYLLFALAVSIIAPLLTFYISAPATPAFVPVISEDPAQIVLGAYSDITNEGSNVVEITLWAVYFAVMSLAFSRVVKNVVYFFRIQRKEESVGFKKARLVLTERAITPHSFINTIFLNKNAYLEGKVEPEVLVHELAHVRQYHSLDILLAQIIQCIFWFNPFLYFYRRSIQLNHEFLADEAAVFSCNNALSYQQLLLIKASGQKQFSLASQFNYSIIKKRLVMISQKTSHSISLLKKITVVSLLVITAFLFVKKETTAQKTEPPKTRSEVPSTTEGITKELLSEYETIVAKHKIANEKNYPNYSEFLQQEKERLLVIYQKMTKEQQDKQVVGFMPKSPVRAKIYPTDAQLKEWLDAKKYFVRINGYKAKNSQLSNHRASDFAYYDFYKPNKGSTDYGRYYAQVNLMTKEAYANYVKSWEQRPAFSLVFFNRPGVKK